MKFAHFSDCHIGGWREQDLRELSIESFEKAIQICVERKVDFVVIAGDLFNTALPSVDALKAVTIRLRLLKDYGISCYVIPGSHDYSPSGKTMIDVLEKAGLCINVFQKPLEFVIDKKTGAKLIGIAGLKQGLEKQHYENIDKTLLEKEPGVKIFLFHTLINELRPKGWEQVPGESISLLPRGFQYYAGGHPHFVLTTQPKDFGVVAYPGPLLPNNFKELEELKHGGFYVVNIDEQKKVEVEHVKIKLKPVLSLFIDAEGKSPREVRENILEHLKKQNTNDHIITLRIAGALASGSVADIGLREIEEDTDCYSFLTNTYGLNVHSFNENEVLQGSVDEIEQRIIESHLNQIEFNFGEELKVTKQLFQHLNQQKLEGEKNADFESRIFNDIIKIFNLEKVFEER